MREILLMKNALSIAGITAAATMAFASPVIADDDDIIDITAPSLPGVSGSKENRKQEIVAATAAAIGRVWSKGQYGNDVREITQLRVTHADKNLDRCFEVIIDMKGSPLLADNERELRNLGEIIRKDFEDVIFVSKNVKAMQSVHQFGVTDEEAVEMRKNNMNGWKDIYKTINKSLKRFEKDTGFNVEIPRSYKKGITEKFYDNVACEEKFDPEVWKPKEVGADGLVPQ
jgi:hypothetical protein